MPIRQLIRNWTFGRSQQTRKRRPVQQRHWEGQLESLETRTLLAAQISGGLYHDLNADGVHDSGESGLADWTVFLDTNANGALDVGEASQRTDADGLYHFTGLTAGNYHVTEVPRAGWTVTNPTTVSADVTVTSSGEAIVNFLNEGTAGTGVITGLVWRDVNNDQVRDPEDTTLASWTMFLDLNGDKILDPDEPSALTDGDGIYTFTGVVGGKSGNSKSYEVTEVIPTGWEPADVNMTAEVVEGQTTVMPDFSNWPDPEKTTSISGRVFNDGNNNGIQDTGEAGLGGWTVYADVNLNGVLDFGEPAATTASNGNYSIGGLEAGGQRIVEIPAGSFTPTSPATGIRNVTTTVGVPLTNVNFGNRQRTDAAFGGVIFVDRDHDGIKDVGEEGLGGIRVYVDANDNGIYDIGEMEMETEYDLYYTPDVDEAGRYRFDHLPGGTYIVRQELPDELSGTPDTELRKVISLGASDDLSDLHGADRYRASEIHGVKFEDVNGNGVRDTGESGIPGVTIFIDLNRDNVFDEGTEPSTLTGSDGSYEFLNLDVGAYIVREVVPAGWTQTFPRTSSPDGILWPGGVSNLPVGNVSPGLIQVSLAEGETHTQTVSLTLPTTGALTNMVDVFLLFDDTGSFTSNSPIVRAAFPSIIAQLQARLTGIDLGFGVGRLEEYGGFASEYGNGRPFILNQPIVAADVGGFEGSIQSALDRVAPGYGGDGPETVIEALYQMVTGAGFDGNNDGDTTDSGAAGIVSTQTNPGSSGDVPAFASFTADTANGVLAASGTIGGAGFRSGALPIIITATDTGFAYQSKGDSIISGIDGVTLPVSAFTDASRGTSPYSSGAGIQETVTGLNALGALVIGLGTADSASAAPRSGLEALATMTGAINQTATTIANGTADPIQTGDPLYFKIGSGGDPLAGNIADGIVAAIDGAVTSVNVNVTLRASDPRVHISFSPGVINGLGAGDTATFDVTFTGDGRPTRFDLQFIREGTDVVLGSIPVVLGTPVAGEGYEYEDCEDGEHSSGVDFGNQRRGSFTPNAAPSFVIGTKQTVDEDSGAQSVAAWATNISPGSPGEAAQLVDFIVSNDNNGLFAVQPSISADGTLSYTPAANAFGSTLVTVKLHDNGGTANGGVDTSGVQSFTINVSPVNDAPAGNVVITGSPTEGQVLTADISAIVDVDGLGAFSYVWSNGETTSSITLVETDVAAAITVTVTYTDAQGTLESLTSEPVGPIGNLNEVPTGTVVITGIAAEDQILTADVSTIADADGLGAFSYLWSNGATTWAITLSDSDVDTTITVRVSYTDGHGTPENLTSQAVGPVVNVNDAPTGTVVITGIATEAEVLTADTSTIGDADGLAACPDTRFPLDIIDEMVYQVFC
ncbi:MAG: SdrD B-like domain-containing protein [Fuerstiella sp.]